MASGGVGKTDVSRSFNIPSLDGIRAIAVLVVFIGHGFTVQESFPGHVGVTIFFFLSGFLITTLMRNEIGRTGTVSLGKFYLRRALRILPPAYLAVAASMAVVLSGLIDATVRPLGVICRGDFGHWRWLNSGRVVVLPVTVVDIVRGLVVEG